MASGDRSFQGNEVSQRLKAWSMNHSVRIGPIRTYLRYERWLPLMVIVLVTVALAHPSFLAPLSDCSSGVLSQVLRFGPVGGLVAVMGLWYRLIHSLMKDLQADREWLRSENERLHRDIKKDN